MKNEEDRSIWRPLQVLAVAFAVCLAAAGAAAQQTFVAEFEVAGLSCDGCAGTATDALSKLPGVTRADVKFATRSARVESSRRIEEKELRAALAQFGFEARFPNDPVVKPLTADERARADIQVASRGEAFDVRKHLARGKYTIFDFWAEWCGPCHVLTPKLERLTLERANVALRTIDLKQWESAAGKQATKEFKIPGLPYVRVYGPDGKFVGAVLGNDIEKIRQLVRAGE
jgi:thioredoxin 1